MKNLFILVILLFTTMKLPAQSVTYLYDNAGNRIERVIPLFSSSPSHAPKQTTSVDDIIASQAIKIYPNPTRGQLAVEITGFADDLHASFLLSSLSGTVIDRQQATSSYLTFDLSNHLSGVYLLKISINGESHTWRIIKE